jgi:hypothetical protein
MKAFVDFTYRIRYLLWTLMAVLTIYFCYTLWTGTNFFLQQSPDFWFGLAFGLVMWGMFHTIKITVQKDKHERAST